MSDESDKAIEELRMQVFDLMGRCVLNIQRYELGMKKFLSVLEMEGTPETWQTNLQKRQAHYGSKTLGQLISDFTGSHISPESSNESEWPLDDSPLPANALIHLKTRYSIVKNEDAHKTLLEDLAYLVTTRNELVHHFLERFPLDDADSCEQAIDYLEAVREMLKSHTERLQGWDKARANAMSAIKRFAESPQFAEWLEFSLPRDHIDWPNAGVVKELKRAESMLSKGGWTDLAPAIEVIKKQNPDLTPKAHGCVSWRNLLHTSGLFDIRRERGQGENSITFFRSR